MELKKLVLATAVFGALGGLYGCSGDEDVNIVVDDNSSADDNSVDNSVSNNNTNTGDDGAAAEEAIRALYPFATFGAEGASSCPAGTTLQTNNGFGVCVLPGLIDTDITLTADTPWVMEDRVVVGNGDGRMGATDGTLESGDAVLDITVTIEPGTYILGSGTNANMVVTRGSNIEAVGTASAPITFASLDDGFTGVGEWGGLIIHGYGLHNQCDYPEDEGGAAVACNIDSEGESGNAGGHDNADSSGTLNYVIVTEAGKEISSGDEINGISFVGVGSGTEVEYIQVNQNLDDGVEFYGGAVNAKYVLLTGNGDDSVDWDEGWIGNMQYVLVVQDAATEGTAVEADTEGSATGFLSQPTIVNATFVGAGAQTKLHVLKSRSAGYFHNTVMTGLDGTIDNCVELVGSSVVANVASGNIVYNNIIADCTTFENVLDGDTTTEGSNIDTTGVFSVPAALDTTTWASTAAEASGAAAFDVTVSELLDDGSFFDDTTFIGAVDPAAATPWFDGWALEGTLP